MIVYDVECTNGHVFTEWFSNSRDYDAKASAGEVACPECGDTDVHKALMAPNVRGSSAMPEPAPCGAPACASGMCQFAGD